MGVLAWGYLPEVRAARAAYPGLRFRGGGPREGVGLHHGPGVVAAFPRSSFRLLIPL